MKKSILLSLVLAFTVSLSAQEKKSVEFTEKTHDFGTIQEGAGEGGRITNVFVFTNVGTTPIYVESAKATCGCTVPQVDKTKLILPGEKGEIPVTYTRTNSVGSFDKNVTVTFKDGSDNTFTEVIRIKGNVTPKAQPTE